MSYVVDAVRTPVGRYGGALAGMRPDDLAAHALRALVDRVPDLDPADIDDVWFGDANGAGEDNRDVARMAVLLAGLPVSVPGATVNRLCGSGLEAVIAADRAIAVGDAAVAVAGGVESMSRAPWVLPKPDTAFPAATRRCIPRRWDGGWSTPACPRSGRCSLGEGAEILAQRHRIGREAQDAFALRSHRRAAAAWDAGRFDDEVSFVTDGEGGRLLERDESIRADTSLEALFRLRPSFRPDGSVTAGNASPLNDGAAAVLLTDEPALGRLGREPVARIAARATSAVEPPLYGLGPVEAAERALKRAGIAMVRPRGRSS